ncbi:MAG: glycosyltransferase family 4 protein [Cardiobacteriaceae bacterium]|nr:glycosyltransferase family 4 protein [Cardiobacteriaceae bacterium]
MNICIATDKFQPSGGMERYVFDLLHGFLERKISTEVLTMKASEQYRKICPVQVLGEFPIAQLKYTFFNQRVQKNIPHSHKIIATSLIDNADILICGGNHLGFLSAMEKKASLKDKLTVKRGISAYKTAKKIVSHSNLMKKELQNFYQIDAEKIITIYPAVDEKKFHPLPENERLNLRQKFGFKESENILVFPSGDHKRKGLSLIIQAIRNLENQLQFPIKIALCGSHKYEDDLIVNLGLVKNMCELYNAADFTILASKYEPFGLVGVESILCGRKIIFADNCGCLEVIKNTDNLFFKHHNLLDLQEKLLLADKMKAENQTAIKNSKEGIFYNPSLDEHIDKLLEII